MTWLRGRDRSDWAMAGIVLAGLVVRVVYVLSQRHVPVEGDGEGYYFSARLLADGHGFISAPAYQLTYMAVPAADHPPAWILLLSTVALAGAKRVVYYQLLAAAVGVATVAVVGATGRRIAGRRCGLIAAAVAAFYPTLWMYERVLLCETLALLLTALCLYVAYGLWERPGLRGAAALGLCSGLLTMTRPEALLLAALLVAPTVLLAARGTPVSLGTRLRWLAVAAVMVVAPIAPWAIYNSLRFEHPVTLTTNLGQTLVAANCPDVFYGPHTGWWSYDCLAVAAENAGPGDASARDLVMRDMARDYVRDQESRLPAVVLAREGRTWGAYQPFYQLELDAVGGPSLDVARAGLVTYWALGVLAVAGAVVLRRRGSPIFPMVAVAATVAIAAGLTFGQTRYRALAEVPLVVLAAVAVDAAVGLGASRRSSTEEILRTQLSLHGGLPSGAPDQATGDMRCLQSPSTTS